MSSTKSNKKVIHNPKSNAPALYFPIWLLNIPHHDLSIGAKILYSRLAQWSNESGVVFRSTAKLAEELGLSKSSIEKYIKELKDVNLIGTFQNQKGGQNNFEFYDHAWMYATIKKELIYNNELPTPPYVNITVPPVKSTHLPVKDEVIHRNDSDFDLPPVISYGTPPEDLTVINNKEIISSSSYSYINDCSKTEQSQNRTTTTEKINLKEKTKNQPQVTKESPLGGILEKMRESISVDKSSSQPKTNKEHITTNRQCLEAFYQKFSDTTVTIDRLYDKFCSMNDETKRTIGRFLGFIRIENVDKAIKTTSDQDELMEARLRRMFDSDRKELDSLVYAKKHGENDSGVEKLDWYYRNHFPLEYDYLMAR